MGPAVDGVHMDVREATPDDGSSLRTIAERSLEASYSLSPTTIEGAVDEWYDDEALDELFADDERRVLLAEEDGEPVGFAELLAPPGATEADLLWLHVAPEHRGHGAGEALFEATRAAVEERGIDHLRGRVLADNAEGNAFYERQGFERAGETEVDIDGKPHVENVYVDEVADLEPFADDDGTRLFVDRTDVDRGSKGGFAVVYAGPDRENRYGYLCTGCERLVTAMDTMGRMECGNCGNVRKPTRWDAAYL